MDAERDALAVAAEVVGVPVEAVEVEVAADLAVLSDPVLTVVVDLVPPRVRVVGLPELDGAGEVRVRFIEVVLDLVGAVVIPRRPRESFRRTACWMNGPARFRNVAHGPLAASASQTGLRRASR